MNALLISAAVTFYTDKNQRKPLISRLGGAQILSGPVLEKRKISFQCWTSNHGSLLCSHVADWVIWAYSCRIPVLYLQSTTLCAATVLRWGTFVIFIVLIYSVWDIQTLDSYTSTGRPVTHKVLLTWIFSFWHLMCICDYKEVIINKFFVLNL
jgi:hypothetical protein